MFSGIVETTARVLRIIKDQENVHFVLQCPFGAELTIDQSVAHNGVCLTVVALGSDGGSTVTFGSDTLTLTTGQYVVTAMSETLERSNLGLLRVGDEVNLERSMMMNGRLDGHIVQGHVDQTAECISKESEDGSFRYTFRYATSKEMALRGYFCVDKGSVTVNGVSLTVCNPTDAVKGDDGLDYATFQVCIIPYTYEITNFHNIEAGTCVNLEFDIIGKYISRYAAILKN